MYIWSTGAIVITKNIPTVPIGLGIVHCPMTTLFVIAMIYQLQQEISCLYFQSTMKDDVINDKQSEMISSYQKQIQNLTKQVKELQFNQTLKDDNDLNELRRKLASYEDQQAEKTRAFNEEATKLQSQVAKLRSALERGETTKQKLEYDLALVNKALSQEKRNAMDKDAKMHKLASEQKGKNTYNITE